MPDPTTVDSWPQAVVFIVVIIAVAVIPSLFAYLNRRIATQAKNVAESANDTARAVHTTLTEHNGGSSVRDYLDRIEAKVDANDAKVEARIADFRTFASQMMRADNDLAAKVEAHLEEAAVRDQRIQQIEEHLRRPE